MDATTYYRQAANTVVRYIAQETDLDPRRGAYRIVAAMDGPQIISLFLAVNPRYATAIQKLAEPLSMAAGLDRDQNIRIGRGARGTLTIEIPKPRDLRHAILYAALPRSHGLQAALGIDAEHRPARADFADPLTPHLLVAGTTGSGKTNALRLIIYDLLRHNDPARLGLLLIDTRKRGRSWQMFAHAPHLRHPVVTDEGEARRVLAWAVAEIDRRAAQDGSAAPVCIAVDEAQHLLADPVFVRLIGAIAEAGREMGIHLILAAQNPTAEQLGSSNVKNNLTARLIGRVDSSAAAANAAGQPDTGAHLLTGPGDMLSLTPNSLRRVAVAYVDPAAAEALPYAAESPRLDLDEYDDAEHVVDQADVARLRADPLEPRHVAEALATGWGITRLAQGLRVGAGKAQRVKVFADGVRAWLADAGYTGIPGIPPAPGEIGNVDK